MIMFYVQAFIFIAVAFGLGCLFGCRLKSRKERTRHSGAASAITHAGAARTATASELAAPIPHYEPATSPQPASIQTSDREAETKAPDVTGASEAGATAEPAKKATKAKSTGSVGKKTSAGTISTPAVASKPADSKPHRAKAAVTAASKSKIGTPASGEVATAKPAAARAPKAKPAAAVTRDNLKQIKGVGPQIEAKLNAAGITSFAQIAAWSKKQQAEFAEQLSFSGRIEREDWVSQAKILAKGGSTDFATRVAKGKVESSPARKPRPEAKA
ncbi:hypothetical protein PZ897_06005 [Hoeflea sp. YIM 152468]|uniref:hypothetical protein n=1 Tax=Hoeflea sp. YIM 152468 TaxID=3031759 RepID=UPI0023D9D271|nr:hypothetical protein [Hoeflea sp. YIM 152468]MDF1607724.1 hypothetical protein [Hoeflea sp. YIM 152468]